MSQPTIKEVIEALSAYDKAMGECGYELSVDKTIADRIEAYGIAPPDGMALVPSEPTENQLFHGYKARAETRLEEVRSIYKAMLSAAPKVQP